MYNNSKTFHTRKKANAGSKSELSFIIYITLQHIAQGFTLAEFLC